MNPKAIVPIILFLFFCCQIRSQGVERIYPMQANQGGLNIRSNQDELFAVCHNNGYFATVSFDSTGDIVNWQPQLANNAVLNWNRSVFGIDNTIITACKVQSGTYGNDVVLAKYDSLNNQLWYTQIQTGDSVDEWPNAVVETVDKSIYVFCMSWGTHNSRLIKTDSLGNLLWVRNFLDVTAVGLLSDTDRGCTLYVKDEFLTPNRDKFIKLDLNGIIQWQDTGMLNGIGQYPKKLLRTSDGGIVTIGYISTLSGYNTYVSKYTANGDSIWQYKLLSNTSTNSGYSAMSDLIETRDGGIVFTGLYNTGSSMYKSYMAKVTGNGDSCLWVRVFNERVDTRAIIEMKNGNLCVIGQFVYLSNESDLWLLIADSMGRVLDNFLLGAIIIDSDSSCNYSTGEVPLKSWLVEAQGTLAIHYATSDDTGNYIMQTQIDSYVVNVFPPSPYWESCIINDSIEFNQVGQTDTLDIGVNAKVMCPWMEVSLGSPCRVRPGDVIGYAINYCNYGTVAADNVQIEIVFPPEVTITHVSVPYNHNSNTYSFFIDSVGLGDCGRFTIFGETDTTLLPGSVICASVLITPDSLCLSGYNGDDPFSDMQCSMVVASLDPNQKTGIPFGAGVDHTIAAETSVSYVVEFQNTGTDTAFKVVIIDTLPLELDVTTFKAGASSHSYKYEVSGSGIVKFIFNPIALPDSNVNSNTSKGFVKFSINQKPGLTNGTVINNSAAIYFDYNSPVITDAWLYTIGEPNSTLDFPIKDPVVQVYPNPAMNQLFVNANDGVIEEVTLCSITGQKIKVVKQFSPTIDISGFCNGIYIAVIKTTKGVAIRKWIKM